MGLFLTTQRTSTNEQYRQASNNAALKEDRIGIQSSHRHRLGGHVAFLLYCLASEIENAHVGPGYQVKVGIADLEGDQHEVAIVSNRISSNG